jgi:hypothetical protein
MLDLQVILPNTRVLENDGASLLANEDVLKTYGEALHHLPLNVRRDKDSQS